MPADVAAWQAGLGTAGQRGVRLRMADYGGAWLGQAGRGWLVIEGHGLAGAGKARRGLAGSAEFGSFRLGVDGAARDGPARQAGARSLMVRCGMGGTAWLA